MADALRQRVSSGAYASESEVIRDGLRTLFARDQVLESWLREEVVSAYDALAADSSAVVGVDDVRGFRRSTPNSSDPRRGRLPAGSTSPTRGCLRFHRRRRVCCHRGGLR
ncbi:ribbon-helix-helix domain-containing protein [Cryobacterium mannosilyticum]|uniref:ribbon-helix-helix domain-containing protein n=1 Tax=Cryobacterium mannosilyticum TaxID=1259190 RepID=UPI003B97C603